jgi:hypothetical protein
MKRLLISMTILALFVVPQLALGSDVDDLKAADDRARMLHNSLDPNDVETYVGLFYKEIIDIEPDSAFPTVLTKDQLRQSKLNSIAQTESVDYTMIDIHYHVAGNTGVVCHYGTEVTKPKDGPTVIRNVRHSITFVKINGKWLVYAYHASVIPAGN